MHSEFMGRDAGRDRRDVVNETFGCHFGQLRRHVTGDRNHMLAVRCEREATQAKAIAQTTPARDSS